jgi:hypothetical protein
VQADDVSVRIVSRYVVSILSQSLDSLPVGHPQRADIKKEFAAVLVTASWYRGQLDDLADAISFRMTWFVRLERGIDDSQNSQNLPTKVYSL